MYTIFTINPISGDTEGALEEALVAEQHIIIEVASNELKLGRGAQSDEIWQSASR